MPEQLTTWHNPTSREIRISRTLSAGEREWFVWAPGGERSDVPPDMDRAFRLGQKCRVLRPGPSPVSVTEAEVDPPADTPAPEAQREPELVDDEPEPEATTSAPEPTAPPLTTTRRRKGRGRR